MLRTRVITAVVLLAVLVLILYLDSYLVFALALAAFFAAAAWEGLRLFGAKSPLPGAALWTAAFLLLAFRGDQAQLPTQFILLIGLSAIFWWCDLRRH